MLAIAAFFIIGVLASRKLDGGGGGRQLLEQVILNWVLPLAILFNIARLEWSTSSVVVVGSCLCVTAIDAAAAYAGGYLLRLDSVQRRTLLLVAPLGNTAYFGFAAVSAVLGQQALPDAILFDQLGTTLMLATYGNYVATYGNSSSIAAALRRLGSFRPVWGLGLGLVLPYVAPGLLTTYLGGLADATTGALMPLSMVALGSRLYLTGIRVDRCLVAGLIIRLLIGPVSILFLGIAISGPALIPPAAILQCAAPSMVAAALLAERNELDSRAAHGMCGIGIPLALGVISVYGQFLV